MNTKKDSKNRVNKNKQKQKKLTLKLQPRKEFGRKVKGLRRKGIIPANIYGPNFKSTSVQVNLRDFLYVYKKVKETGVVYLDLDKKKEIPILITNLQRHPINDNILHIDFRKIDLKKKIETTVPIKLKGESEAVKQKGGIILTLSETLTIEALPEDIPSHIEIDISKLKEIGQEIKVSHLPKSKKFIIKEPEEKVIVSITAHKEEKTPEVPPSPAKETPEAKEKSEEESKIKEKTSEEKPTKTESSPETKK